MDQNNGICVNFYSLLKLSLFHSSYQQSNLETQHLIHCCQEASAVAQQLTANDDVKTITHQVWK